MSRPGAIYHLMNRGDRREEIFRDDQDRESFIATLAEACAKAAWQVHAYCLMGNLTFTWWSRRLKAIWWPE